MDIFEYRAYNQDVRGKASGRRVFYRGERMTINEASERYSIPLDILKEYESWGLCGAVKKVMGAWQYDDGDIERLGTIMALHDIGLSSEEIEAYMRLTLEQGGSSEEVLRMIDRRRDKALDEIHFRERQLERLDYLRHELRSMSKNP